MVYNPLVPVIEFFRVAFLGEGTTSGIQLAYSAASVIVIFFIGSILFNKMGSKLIDVV
jgi:lipopolysaccharide transport system permease protein